MSQAALGESSAEMLSFRIVDLEAATSVLHHAKDSSLVIDVTPFSFFDSHEAIYNGGRGLFRIGKAKLRTRTTSSRNICWKRHTRARMSNWCCFYT